MQITKLQKTISIIAATAFALFAGGLTVAHAESPGGGGPDSALCDGSGPGGGEPRFDGSGRGEGKHLRGMERVGRGEPRVERRGDGAGTPRYDGKGPRHEDAPRLGLGRTGDGRFGQGECGRERLRDGSGKVRNQGRQAGVNRGAGRGGAR